MFTFAENTVNNKNMINSGRICPYCGAKTEYIDSSYIYGRSYGMVYICKPCDAYVGVHKGTDISLGRLANKHLRRAKKDAHLYFDQIAKTSLINKIWPEYLSGVNNRNKAYKWLSKQLNIPEEICHIGMFDIEQCNAVVKLCRPIAESLK